MSVDHNLMSKVHRLLRQKTDLTDRIASGPRQVRVVEKDSQVIRDSVDEAKQVVVKTKMAADEKQLHLGTREAKIESLKQKLNACESNKEYKLLTDAIAADTQANNVLSDEILEILERIDQLENDLADKNKQLKASVEKLEMIKQRVQESSAKLKTELAEVSSELEQAEKGLTGEIGKEYRHIVSAQGEDALAQSDGKTCGNCQQTFTAQTYNDLLTKKPVICSGCGSLMYLLNSRPATQES